MATKQSVIEALARLDGNQDFERVLEHLDELKERAIQAGAVATELIFIGRAQGSQATLGDFLKLARDARHLAAGKRGG